MANIRTENMKKAKKLFDQYIAKGYGRTAAYCKISAKTGWSYVTVQRYILAMENDLKPTE